MSFNLMLTQAQMLFRVQQVLSGQYAANQAAQQLYRWTSGLALADVEGFGFAAPDAQAILNAAADANGAATLYFNGTVTQSLPYNFSASALTVLGPPPS